MELLLSTHWKLSFFPDIFFTSTHTLVTRRTSLSQDPLFIFCTFEKPRGKFIRTIIPFDNRDRSIISNRKFPTRYHRSIVSIPPRYLHLFLHLRSSKLVKKKKEKKYHACGIRQDLRYRLVCKSSSRWHGRTRLARVWQMDRNYQLSPAVSSRLCFW